MFTNERKVGLFYCEYRKYNSIRMRKYSKFLEHPYSTCISSLQTKTFSVVSYRTIGTRLTLHPFVGEAWVYHRSRFSRDSPNFCALSRPVNFYVPIFPTLRDVTTFLRRKSRNPRQIYSRDLSFVRSQLFRN